MELKDAPNKPGVYIFKDKEGKPIYIGKAGSLKKRLSSYISPKSLKISILLSQSSSLEWFLCDSELEALLLEANLIKKHKPKFNVSLKDDKAYPFIKITKEEFPRILTTRRLTKDGYCFGPYKAGLLRKTIKIAKEVFKLRSCKKMPNKPCLLFHIGQCLAPCKNEISNIEYNKNVKDAIAFLSGRCKMLLKSLERRMKYEASKLNFEKAGKIRDEIFAIKSLSEAQKAFFTKPINYDVIGQSSIPCVIFVLVIREGRLIGEYPFTISSQEDAISGFIKQFYLFAGNIPDEIVIEKDIEDKALIEEALSKIKKKRVLIKIPKRGKKRELLLLSKKNADLFALRNSQIRQGIFDIFKFFPKTIEAIDISNISSDYAVASLVVFENGMPNRDEYRKFRIRAKGPDDTGMIREVLERRLKRLIKENKRLPDLFLIDGGRGQLNVAIDTIKTLGLKLNVASIAKDPDRIFLPDKEPIPLSDSLFQHIRDEAHRFAISYHKKLRRLSLFS
ncbi:MAG: excinuclease ABC subunit UvrC [bacterium]